MSDRIHRILWHVRANGEAACLDSDEFEGTWPTLPDEPGLYVAAADMTTGEWTIKRIADAIALESVAPGGEPSYREQVFAEDAVKKALEKERERLGVSANGTHELPIASEAATWHGICDTQRELIEQLFDIIQGRA